jgi:hypothetical protein
LPDGRVGSGRRRADQHRGRNPKVGEQPSHLRSFSRDVEWGCWRVAVGVAETFERLDVQRGLPADDAAVADAEGGADALAVGELVAVAPAQLDPSQRDGLCPVRDDPVDVDGLLEVLVARAGEERAQSPGATQDAARGVKLDFGVRLGECGVEVLACERVAEALAGGEVVVDHLGRTASRWARSSVDGGCFSVAHGVSQAVARVRTRRTTPEAR